MIIKSLSVEILNVNIYTAMPQTNYRLGDERGWRGMGEERRENQSYLLTKYIRPHIMRYFIIYDIIRCMLRQNAYTSSEDWVLDLLKNKQRKHNLLQTQYEAMYTYIGQCIVARRTHGYSASSKTCPTGICCSLGIYTRHQQVATVKVEDSTCKVMTYR